MSSHLANVIFTLGEMFVVLCIDILNALRPEFVVNALVDIIKLGINIPFPRLELIYVLGPIYSICPSFRPLSIKHQRSK